MEMSKTSPSARLTSSRPSAAKLISSGFSTDGTAWARRGIDLNLIWFKVLDSALDYYTPVLIASERAMREQSDKMRRFMAAVTQGYTYAIAHPDESAEILIRAAPELNADLDVRL